jgi:hypothetical protein
MRCGARWAIKAKKSYPETVESGQFWCSTYLDRDTRLRVARGIAKNETLASSKVFEALKSRGHPEGPPPTISDGWGGIDEAMIAVYGLIPEYGGRGRPPTRKKPGTDWLYLQMVKQHDEHGHFLGTKLRAIYGSKTEVVDLLGESTAYIERSNLTSRTFNVRQTRKTWAFSKEVFFHETAALLEDCYYNLVHPHKSLRLSLADALPQKCLPRTPAMASNLTDHIWSVKELFSVVPIPINTK